MFVSVALIPVHVHVKIPPVATPITGVPAAEQVCTSPFVLMHGPEFPLFKDVVEVDHVAPAGAVSVPVNVAPLPSLKATASISASLVGFVRAVVLIVSLTVQPLPPQFVTLRVYDPPNPSFGLETDVSAFACLAPSRRISVAKNRLPKWNRLTINSPCTHPSLRVTRSITGQLTCQIRHYYRNYICLF